ncbi:MAG: NAD(P)/FAD-dependent oxidoreductase [Gemmataceae bacterium]
MAEPYDYLVLGAGMGGLSAAALLARTGRRVCLLEAHEHPGGCAHSFTKGPYTFCAAVHYIFFCGEGEPVYNLLRKLGLHLEVPFDRLDPEGYDHFNCPAERLSFRIPNGLDKWADRLVDRFPSHKPGIDRFFSVVGDLGRQLRRLPHALSWRELLSAPLRFPAVLRYRRWTLEDLFDACRLPRPVRAILATQVGDLGLPPGRVSLAIYTALVHAYGSGAYYPRKGFRHFVEALAGVVRDAPGCRLELNAEVAQVRFDRGRVAGVKTRDGREFAAKAVISNMDPAAFVRLAGKEFFPRSFLRRVAYRHSVSSFTLYLVVRGLDLRRHGFGRWNVWHYPHLDINRTYREQEAGDLTDPWLFLSTPTLHGDGFGCPEGTQILEAVTTCGHAPFRQQLAEDRRAYLRDKSAVVDRVLDTLDRHYIPGVRKHLAFRMAGLPTTTEPLPASAARQHLRPRA